MNNFKKHEMFILAVIFLFVDLNFCFSQSGWINQNSGINTEINSIYFRDSLAGLCIGDFGKIIMTTNAGSNWFPVSSGTQKSLKAMSFSSNTIGFIVGDSGVNLKTTDGGFTWNPSNIPNYAINFMTVFFINKNIGFAGGRKFTFSQGYIYKSTNGGTSWDSIPDTYKGSYVKQLFFVSPEIGWSIKFEPPLGTEFVKKTTDGGNNWFYQFNDIRINSLYFIDSLKGWFLNEFPPFLVYRTTSGGANWVSCFPCGITPGNSLIFINKNNGWISGLQDIYYSSNGGLNWTTQTTDHLVKYNGIYFIDSLTGWAAGDSGIILKTTTGGVLTGFTNTSAEIPEKYFLSQNYPNPFNPETVISYELPVTSRTKLKVYDVLGNEIATLVNETKPAGSYNYQFSTVNYQLSSGVYLYRLEIDGNIIDTKRMVLLK